MNAMSSSNVSRVPIFGGSSLCAKKRNHAKLYHVEVELAEWTTLGLRVKVQMEEGLAEVVHFVPVHEAHHVVWTHSTVNSIRNEVI